MPSKTKLFGPVSLTLPSENIDEMNDKEREQLKKQEAHERELINKGCNRVVKKVRSMTKFFKSSCARHKKRLWKVCV